MSPHPIEVSGFTIVRNAEKLDYPFRESVRSLLPLCDEVIINCGDSSDGTRKICAELEAEAPGKIRVIESTWQRENQAGGFQLKHQSDIALAACRGRWCAYIQADEVLHEGDVPALRAAMRKADSVEAIDGLVSDYLHFYGNYSYYITGRNWYRREVRLFKNHRGIAAYRDAQGFRKNGERLVAARSGGKIFHYGHVRSSADLRKKSEEMAQWWGETPVTDPEGLRPKRHVGLKAFRESHPAVMAQRLSRNAEYWDPSQCPRSWNLDEVKNALTLFWESLVPYRFGEFRNYELTKGL